MSIRTRLSVMLFVSLSGIILLAGGTSYIFENLSRHMTMLISVSQEDRLYAELDRNTHNFVEATRSWSITGDKEYIKNYAKTLLNLRNNIEHISAIPNHHNDWEKTVAKFEQLFELAKTVIKTPYPVGEIEIVKTINKIEILDAEITTHIDAAKSHTMSVISDVAKSGDSVKKRMLVYHTSLFFVIAMISLFLLISVRRTISEPFNKLLKATEKISRGDLQYRINMDRTDELGTIAKSFDEMVEKLEISNKGIQRKLHETLLLLDVAKIASETLDIKNALSLIADLVSKRLGHDTCSVYLLNPEKDAFCFEASNNAEEKNEEVCISKNSVIAGRLRTDMKPVLFQSSEISEKDGFKIDERYQTALVVPVYRDNLLAGILIMNNRDAYSYSEVEISTTMILSHTIGALLRNARLYKSKQKQLEKLTVLYELNRAITSLLDLDELLKIIAGEIAKLISSKGCLIRLLEDGKLKVKSHYGLGEGQEKEMDLALGEGLAGWVAEHGESRFMEKTGTTEMKVIVPDTDVISAVCVPLKIGGEVIGTLGLYNKYDAQDNIIPFTNDDLVTVEGFASISALAIEKARIHEKELARQIKSDQERRRLNILFDSVQGGIITLDNTFNITSANRFIEEWINIPVKDIVGKNSVDIFHEKNGICPHCAAKNTFDTGKINSIMQSRGVNYAELTAYPVINTFNQVIECVVFIMDITDRILYQEETMSLYREVMQTKEYLESIINNSADSIVTSDIEGMITSWNNGAERIFGYTASEVTGKFLPFVPEFVLDSEREYIRRIKQGEVLKDIETLRVRKDGTFIEISLTLSPVKDASGEVIGVCGISRDISERKRVEKEINRKNQELSRLFFISSAMRSTLDLERLLRMVLTAVTMSEGMGFNRALLFLVDDERKTLKGMMGVGPATPEDAWKIWDDLSMNKRSLDDIIEEILAGSKATDSFLERLTRGIELSLEDNTVLTMSVNEKRPFNVADVKSEPLSDTLLIQQLGTQAYAVVPLISRDKVIGLIWVDNCFNNKSITEEDMQFLSSFSNYIASAIESARLFEQVAMAEQQLENIFESISDLVYFNSSDYVIKRVNKAVINKIGLPQSEIVGRKCYEIFHGIHGPLEKCPHHKTVDTKKAYIEEIDEPHLGGTFLISSSPIFDKSGEFLGSVHIARDISELKTMQKKLVLSEKMAALGEVAARVAHEIRNPLVSVGGFAKRLEKKLDGNLQEYAGIIVKEVARLEGILKEILGFVREIRLSLETVRLDNIVQEVVSIMKSDIEERGISLELQYGSSAEVVVDPNRIKEAILNIITNAVQSIAGRGSITVQTGIMDNNAFLVISDTGKGISESDMPNIFNPFFTTKTSGTGLGLAITNRIIQEHNGYIEVYSRIDEGTTFKVYLPQKGATA